SLERARREQVFLAAVHEWGAIGVMQLTWGLEREPFYRRGPYAGPWKALRRRAAAGITAALGCGNRRKGISLRTRNRRRPLRHLRRVGTVLLCQGVSMKRLISVLVILLVVQPTARAQAPSTTVRGYVID